MRHTHRIQRIIRSADIYESKLLIPKILSLSIYPIGNDGVFTKETSLYPNYFQALTRRTFDVSVPYTVVPVNRMTLLTNPYSLKANDI